LAVFHQDRCLRRDIDWEVNGQTGLTCFDSWATELVVTDYLHNQARIWLVSIWIFTLGLPLWLRQVSTIFICWMAMWRNI
jgi:deoxyribodipyrimidine photo-lyase